MFVAVDLGSWGGAVGHKAAAGRAVGAVVSSGGFLCHIVSSGYGRILPKKDKDVEYFLKITYV